MKLRNFVSSVTFLALSSSVNAEIISVDWQTAGDNLITRDTVSGLEWLDISVTRGLSDTYDVAPGLEQGQQFEGWRYATAAELGGFFDAFGGDSDHYYDGLSTENNGLFDRIAPFWGDAWCQHTGCETGEGWTSVKIADEDPDDGFFWIASIVDDVTNDLFLTHDYIKIHNQFVYDWMDEELATGSALVRSVTTVPVPAAIWLFGFGLLGLVGFARRNYKGA